MYAHIVNMYILILIVYINKFQVQFLYHTMIIRLIKISKQKRKNRENLVIK